MSEEPSAWVGGTFAEKYVVESQLGAGAMGNVFRVRHIKLGRQFALKLLHTGLLTDATVCKRFEREAELIGRLRHPNCIGVIDVGSHDGTSYIVMELADGVALSSLLENGPLPHARAFALLRQLCDGLEHAHARGVIHRDLKPDNVIVEHDGLRIVDFGIALLREAHASDAERLTRVGFILGTPRYMAPELACGRDYDHRVDLFALGVISFEMFTGRAPFEGSGVELALANVSQPTPQMPDIDPLIEAFTHKLMAKDPTERLSSARHVRELLDLIERDRDAATRALGLATIVPELIVSDPVTAPAPAVSVRENDDPAPRPRRIRRIIGAASTFAIALLGTFGLASAHHSIDEDAPRFEIAAPSDPDSSTRAGTARIERPVASPQERVVTLARPQAAPMQHRALEATRLVTQRTATGQQQQPEPQAQPQAQPQPQPQHQAPAARTSTTADSVAKLYIAVGGALKKMGEAGGDTNELWNIYRRIRIQDVMASPALREQAVAVLSALDHQLAQRR